MADSAMDVDTPPKVAAPNQRAVAAVAVAPPARKGRHWAAQQQSPPPRDSSWSPVSREQVKAVMTRYRQLQTEFWSSQLQQAPQVLPANQELLQQRVAELMQKRMGKPLVEDEGDAAAEAEAEAAGPAAAAAAAAGGGRQAGTSSSRPPAGDEHAAAADEQQHGGRGHSKARTSDSSGGSSGDDDSSGSSGGGSDADDEDELRAQQQASAGWQQQRQQQPGRRRHGKKARAVYGRYSTNEVKLLKKRAYRLQYEQRLPAYVSWMYLVRNELSVDKGQRMFYTDETGETVPASDDEDGNLKPWQSKGGQSHDYALMRLAEEHAADLGGLFAVLEVGLEERAENVTADELAARLRQLREAEAPKMPPTEEERRAAPFAESLSTFHRHFCRRCNIYNCRLHGGGHVQPVLQPPPPPPPAPDAPPCCSSCWRAVQQPAAAATADTAADAGAAAGSSGAAAAAAAATAAASPGDEPGDAAAGDAAAASEFDDYEEGLLHEGLKVFGRDPCSLALLLAGRSCAEIGRHLQLQIEDTGQTAAEEGAAEPSATDAARKRKKRAATVTVPARKHVMHRRWQLSGDEEWAPYSPCSCAGPCKKGSCPCIASANFCEKFCGCVGCEKRDCTFQGCTCTTRCRNERCPCMAAGRECDPDVCRNCATTARGTAAPDERCGNMGMRLRKHARLHMGLSNVSGWGAFLGEAARKGDFLGEYVGEMLSQQEADRRGKAYDRSNNSYLFGVNKEWVLDAKACGNKLRFANHRSHPNCQTRVLMVDGDHRVGIYAKEDIAAGEELFYNYRYDLDNAPDWAIRE